MLSGVLSLISPATWSIRSSVSSSLALSIRLDDCAASAVAASVLPAAALALASSALFDAEPSRSFAWLTRSSKPMCFPPLCGLTHRLHGHHPPAAHPAPDASVGRRRNDGKYKPCPARRKR